jgi:hypothetical protein
MPRWPRPPGSPADSRHPRATEWTNSMVPGSTSAPPKGPLPGRCSAIRSSSRPRRGRPRGGGAVVDPDKLARSYPDNDAEACAMPLADMSRRTSAGFRARATPTPGPMAQRHWIMALKCHVGRERACTPRANRGSYPGRAASAGNPPASPRPGEEVTPGEPHRPVTRLRLHGQARNLTRESHIGR